MHHRRKKPTAAQTAIQLCLFSPEAMVLMTEKRDPIKVRTDQNFGDWVLWELGLLSSLTGKSYRDQRSFLTGKTLPKKPKPKPVISDGMIAYYAMLDCLSDDKRLSGEQQSPYLPYA